jgi:phosphate acetyltransferase
MNLPESASAWFGGLVNQVRKLRTKPRIVFPEGEDPRVQNAAERLARDGLIEPILITKSTPCDDPQRCTYYFERRKSKGITEAQAAAMAQKPLYAAALMVAVG